MPVHVVEELKEKQQRLLAHEPKKAVAEHRQNVHKQLFNAYEHYLDSVSTIDWLCDPRIASMLRQNLYHHDGSKYHLRAYCIMPNHVHAVLTPSPANVDADFDERLSQVGESFDRGSPLSKIMHSLKS